MHAGNTRPLSPGQARGREHQQAAALFAPSRPPSQPGEHSVWCDLLLVEKGFYPLRADGVVAVLTEGKLFLRLTATGFTFTVHLTDVALLRHVATVGVVELHVRVPGAAPYDTAAHSPPLSSASLPFTALRLYQLRVTERAPQMSAALFRALFDLLPSPRQQRDAQEITKDAGEVEEEGGQQGTGALADYWVDHPRSMLPPDLLSRTGLTEVTFSLSVPAVSSSRVSSPTGPSPVAQGPWDPTPPPPPQQQQQQQHHSSPLPLYDRQSEEAGHGHAYNVTASSLASATTGHLRKIYVAPSPSYWRLPSHAAPNTAVDGNSTWSSSRGQSSLPQPHLSAHAAPSVSRLGGQLSTAPGHTRPFPQKSPVGYRQPSASPLPSRAQQGVRAAAGVVDMSSRESSLMADLCGLRPLPAQASVASSRTSQNTSRTVSVQYGPIVSG